MARLGRRQPNRPIVRRGAVSTSVEVTADATLDVTATLSTAATTTQPAAASLAVTATLSTAATSTQSAAAALPVTATLTTAAVRTQPAAASLAVTATLRAAVREKQVKGIAVSGGEFGVDGAPLTSAAEAIPNFSQVNIGVYNSDYHFDSLASLQFLAALGWKTVRIPLRPERFFTAYTSTGVTVRSAEVTRLLGHLDNINTAGMKAYLDFHTYGYVYLAPNSSTAGTRYAIGGATFTATAFADLWGQLATSVGNHAAIVGGGGYELCNEPRSTTGGENLTAAMWRTASQSALTAIRAAETAAGWQNAWILVDGYQFSDLWNWSTINGATSWITDPAGRFRYAPHWYWGGYADGANHCNPAMGRYSNEVANAGTQGYATGTFDALHTRLIGASASPRSELAQFEDWLTANGLNLIDHCVIGEFGWNHNHDTSAYDNTASDYVAGTYTGDQASFNALGDRVLSDLDSRQVSWLSWSTGEWYNSGGAVPSDPKVIYYDSPGGTLNTKLPQASTYEAHLGTQAAASLAVTATLTAGTVTTQLAAASLAVTATLTTTGVPTHYNTAEGGTSGVAATPANTGGASGTAATRVVLGTTPGAVTFDNAWVAHGALSYLIAQPNAFACYLGWDIASTSSFAVRVAAKLDTLPAAATQFIRIMQAGDAVNVGNLFINSNGSIGFQDASAVTQWTSAAAVVAAGGSYWFQAYVRVGAGTGELRAAVYAEGSTTPLADSGLLTGQALGSTNVGTWRAGRASNASGSWTLHVDDLAWAEGATGFIGPAAGGITQTGAASLAVTATLATSAQTVTLAAASLAATATLATTATATYPVAASVAATATLATTATASLLASASLPVTATLSATAVRVFTAAATLPVTAALSVAATTGPVAAVALPVTATLTTTATTTLAAAAAVAVTAALSTAAVRTFTADATVAVTAALITTAARTAVVAAQLAVTATLAPAATTTQSAAAALAVTASLSVAAVVGTAAALPVTATLTAAATRTAVVTATLTATATLTTTAARTAVVAAQLAAVVTLTPGGTLAGFMSAALAVLAGLAVSADVIPAVPPLVPRPGSGTVPRPAVGWGAGFGSPPWATSRPATVTRAVAGLVPRP